MAGNLARICYFWAAFALTSTIPALAQDAPDISAGFSLLPQAGAPIAPSVASDLRATSTTRSGSVTVFAPLQQSEKGALMFDGALTATQNDGARASSAAAGLVLRHRAGPQTLWGANLYFDGFRRDGAPDLGQFSFGAEYEHRSKDGRTFVQAGLNAYRAQKDYTALNLSAAPRDGADAYVSVGKLIHRTTIRGTALAFGYAGTPTAEALRGYGLDVEAAFSPARAPNLNVTLGIGLRDGATGGAKPEGQISLSMVWTLGGNRASPSDCAILRDDAGKARLDCRAHVMATDSTFRAKDGTMVADDRDGARALAITPSRPRRNLGFGTALVPITLKAGGDDGKDDGDGTDVTPPPPATARLTIEEISLPRFDASGPVMFWVQGCAHSPWQFTGGGGVSANVPVTYQDSHSDLASYGMFDSDWMQPANQQPVCRGQATVTVPADAALTLTQQGGGADAALLLTFGRFSDAGTTFDSIEETIMGYHCAAPGADFATVPLITPTTPGQIEIPAIYEGETLHCRVLNGSVTAP